MAAPLDIGRLFDLGIDILGTTLGKVSGVILAQTGDSTAQRVKANKAEWWQTTGFASRPALPSQGGASCQGLAIKCSDRHIVFAARDVRGTSILGNLADGEACVYAPAGMGAAYFKKNGAVFLSTTDDNTPGGNQILFSISPVAASGGKGGEIRAYCASVGGFWYDASGYHARHWFGGSDDVGVAQIPGIPVQTTTRTLAYDMINLSGAFVNAGGNGPSSISDNVVQTTIFSGLMLAFSTAATAFGAAGAAFSISAAAYVTGIKAVADPSSAVTPAMLTALGTLGTAFTTFAGAAVTAFGALKLAVTTKSFTAS